jgi:hypothetical protein
MVDTYKKESALLYQTGGGVEPENTGDTGGQHTGVGLEEDAEGIVTMDGRCLPYYIPPEGPTFSTASDAVNLWGKCRVLHFCMLNLSSYRSNLWPLQVVCQTSQAHVYTPKYHSYLPYHGNWTVWCRNYFGPGPRR